MPTEDQITKIKFSDSDLYRGLDWENYVDSGMFEKEIPNFVRPAPRLFWVLSSPADYVRFDFDPDPINTSAENLKVASPLPPFGEWSIGSRITVFYTDDVLNPTKYVEVQYQAISMTSKAIEDLAKEKPLLANLLEFAIANGLSNRIESIGYWNVVKTKEYNLQGEQTSSETKRKKRKQSKNNVLPLLGIGAGLVINSPIVIFGSLGYFLFQQQQKSKGRLEKLGLKKQ